MEAPFNHTISQSSVSLITKLIQKSYKENEQQEVLNDIVAIIDEVKRDNKISSDILRNEVADKLKGELATKDFVRAEIVEAKQELKQDIADVRTEIAELRTELKQDIAELRTELKQDIAELRTEIAEVREDNRSLRQEMKFYAIGLGVLIIILQPKVFDFITAFLK